MHAELVRRASASDMSLRAYLRQVLSDHVAVPSMDAWLRRVRDLGPAHAGGPTGPELVAAARAEDDDLVWRLLCRRAVPRCRGGADAVAAPAHLDAEVLSALGRLHRAGQLTRPAERVAALASFRANRWPLRPLLAPAWAAWQPGTRGARHRSRGGTTTSATPRAVTPMPTKDSPLTRSPKSRYASTAVATGTR
ncbi:hypothetical protein SAMN06893096_104102 [Geodermatophilus pulveris]|uniref:Uncharacterized protein n=1 Tax=Geodermatophilus pulveris TaxID=1564159 RepID=A0A239EHW2_9ACTN|nr:hypothetical protein SAMN06893096_104102 [Geodermatophilus pulveris]